MTTTTTELATPLSAGVILPDKLAHLNHKAQAIRRDIVTMVFHANSGHIGGSLSATELLVALYYGIMRHDPKHPQWRERDRFIPSKGHCTPVLYAVLADCGYFPKRTWRAFAVLARTCRATRTSPRRPALKLPPGRWGWACPRP